jgi:hypothetical protein
MSGPAAARDRVPVDDIRGQLPVEPVQDGEACPNIYLIL